MVDLAAADYGLTWLLCTRWSSRLIFRLKAEATGLEKRKRLVASALRRKDK
jgi:hypothetical protein